jgi:Tfp pilus assembly protein PilW
MKVKLINLVAAIFLFSCGNSSSKSKTSSSSDATKVADVEASNQLYDTAYQHYANVIKIISKSDTTFIDADYIQYLLGDKAIEAARKAKQVDTFKNADGSLDFAVPNDYFIVNESTKVRQLVIANNCEFDLILNPDRTNKIFKNTLAGFKKIYKDSPFILTLDKQGRIIKIKEVFLP